MRNMQIFKGGGGGRRRPGMLPGLGPLVPSIHLGESQCIKFMFNYGGFSFISFCRKSITHSAGSTFLRDSAVEKLNRLRY